MQVVPSHTAVTMAATTVLVDGAWRERGAEWKIYNITTLGPPVPGQTHAANTPVRCLLPNTFRFFKTHVLCFLNGVYSTREY